MEKFSLVNDCQSADEKDMKLSLESLLFDNLPKLIRPKILSRELGIAVATIYDWKYRAKMRKIPQNLFAKIGGALYVRRDVLRQLVEQSSSFT